MYIPIILGTAREGRQSEKVAKFILEQTKKAGVESDIIDTRSFRIEATDNTQSQPEAKEYAEKVEKADGLIVVSPEYNHSFPGELKMMLDMAYRQYFNKPIGFCGVSAGPLGGARAVENLRLVSVELHMVPIREALYFPVVQDLFDENGKINDDAYLRRFKRFLDELLWYAEALKPARKNKKGD